MRCEMTVWRYRRVEENIDSVEEIEEVEIRIYNVRQQKISGDNIYQFLLYFDKLYDNEEFFKNFKESRSKEINFNDCIETPILLSLLPKLQGRTVDKLSCL